MPLHPPHGLVITALALATACSPTGEPATAAAQTTPTPSAEPEAPPELVEQHERLFAALLARAPDEQMPRRIRILALAEAQARTRSHDAARALAELGLSSVRRFSVNSREYRLYDGGRKLAVLEFGSDPEDVETCMSARPGAVTLHELATGESLGRIPLPEPTAQIEVSPDGRLLAITDDQDFGVLRMPDGAVVFQKEHSDCMPDPMELPMELDMFWEPSGAALGVSRFDGELIVARADGHVLLRRAPPPDQSDPWSTPGARAALWRELGFEAVETPADPEPQERRLVRSGDVYSIHGDDDAALGVIAAGRAPTRARFIPGRPNLVAVEYRDGVAVFDWTTEGLFGLVCRHVGGDGLNTDEWAEHLPGWEWTARCEQHS